MTVTCPDGHESSTTDYCDVCGVPIPSAAEPEQAPMPEPAEPASMRAKPQSAEDDDELDTSPARPRGSCPTCLTPRSGDDRFCEQCGFDFSGPMPAVGEAGGSSDWEVVVAADRALYDRQSATVGFPAGYCERRFALMDAQLRIGCSRDGGIAPEIDLAGTPSDPGISRLHAVLERQPDGTYTLRDLGSTNGTCLNEGANPIGPDAAVPVGDGDRIHVGAWTTITLHRC